MTPAVPRSLGAIYSWRWLVVLAALFLLVWLAPPLAWLKQSETVFPLWLHTLEEFFAIVVALLVFAVAWQAYAVDRPGNVVILGCGFLAVGLLDLAHMLSYKGMPDFVTPAAPQKAICFWLAARYTAALTLLLVAIRPWTPLPQPQRRYALLLAALVLALVIYVWQLWFPASWPQMFIEGQGLTATKIALEYGVIVLLLLAAYMSYRNRARVQEIQLPDLVTAILITVLSELCFTLYSNVNDIFSLLGHSYKVLAYIFIYRAVFVASVRQPYQRLQAEMAARQQVQARVDYLDYHDSLTGLANRALALHHFNRALVHCQRTEQKLALVVIDIDNFRTIIESLGHQAGDDLLKAVAGRLQPLLRENDLLSRQSGDEFLLTLTELSELDTVSALLAKVMQAFNIPFELAPNVIPSTASIGVAVYPDDGNDFDTLMKHANIAMFRAQADGRATYRFYNDVMNAEAKERLELLKGLHQALSQQQFVVYYQPQFDLESGQLIGAEALIRWQHPTRGLVAPGRFIPLAEGSGLIVPIGDWVLRAACRQMVQWRQAGLPLTVVAVNLSAMQLLRGDIVEQVDAVLRETGLPPSALELELTESLLIQDVDKVLAIIRQLHRLGVRLSIDDFGTGYSSLSYLKQFRVDKLKIDQSFVRDLLTDADDAAIVRTIILLAQSLGLRTIAEGVEDESILTVLRTLGCDEAQGYFLGRPMPAAEFQQRFSASRQEAPV